MIFSKIKNLFLFLRKKFGHIRVIAKSIIMIAFIYIYPEKAYLFSKKAHEGQFRRSGEPYISHPVGVSEILAELKLDLPTIMTGLLHDTVEDTDVTLEDIEKNFGSVVSELVDGVTKITQLSFRNTHEKQSENVRKSLLTFTNSQGVPENFLKM